MPDMKDVLDEMWTEIFSHLPRNALMQVHLTQRRLRAISRPFLFRQFHFHNSTSLDIASQRLQFWVSSEISPLVRQCCVKPLRRLGGWGTVGWSLLAEFFNSLHHFANLRHLTVAEVHYNAKFVRNLRLLPHLTHLEIRNCKMEEIADLATLPPLEISEFAYLGLVPESYPQHWFPFLLRSKLHYLSIPYDQWLFTHILSGDAFPYVTRLELSIKARTLLSNLQILAKFSATEVLTLCNYSSLPADSSGESGEPPIPLADVLASLGEYRGPYGLLDMFLPIPSLRRLVLPCVKPDEHLPKLQSINTPNRITSSTCDSATSAMGIFALFVVIIPHWTEDDYEEYYLGEQSSWEVYDLFEDLADKLPFPASISRLAIHWEYEDDKTHVEDGPPDVHALKDALVSKYPSFKAIWAGALYHEDEIGLQNEDDEDEHWGEFYGDCVYSS
ncbi:hypothetical protein DFH08DRAFT_1023156 [Mycena albidolilacea]|uniref:F-box domain-containing protein n=1 Tax=Mycena albidolilacea TaxID=1033008 RepID=A0AAD6ZMD8_9AGAR|nr:hypothetical protein DFH08DRAFT_1023156 [Mycena albidolilacea]